MQTQLVPTSVGQRRGMLPLQRPRSLSPSTRRAAAALIPAQGGSHRSELVLEQVSPALQGALDALLRDIEAKGRIPGGSEKPRGRRRSSATTVVDQSLTKASPQEQAECLRFLAQWLLRNREA